VARGGDGDVPADVGLEEVLDRPVRRDVDVGRVQPVQVLGGAVNRYSMMPKMGTERRRK
jgi:hypothetical protein